MSGEKDVYTFQYGEVKRGQAYALAMAKVTENFMRANFHSSPNYEKLILAVLDQLTRDASMDDKMLHGLELALMARQNAVLKEEREKDKDRKKFVFENRAKGRDINEVSESDDDAEEALTEEQLAARKAAAEAEEKRKEEEYTKAQERFEATLLQRQENEERLRSQARKVDVAAFERQLQSRGAVLLNAGTGSKNKKGGGGKGAGGKAGQFSAEEAAQMKTDVALVMKEKLRLEAVLHTSEEELPGTLAEAKASLAEFATKADAIGAPDCPPKEMSKAEATQLQQKLTKQTMDKNRLALQLKAMEPNEVRDELLSVLEQRDVLAVKVEQAESA